MKCGYCGQESVAEYCSLEHEENHIVFDIMEKITDELDIVFKATSYPWKVDLTSASYDTLKNRPGTNWNSEPRNLIYSKDGHEYLVCWENHNIPFIIHARIASINASGDRMDLDDLGNPNILQEYNDDWLASA